MFRWDNFYRGLARDVGKVRFEFAWKMYEDMCLLDTRILEYADSCVVYILRVQVLKFVIGIAIILEYLKVTVTYERRIDE